MKITEENILGLSRLCRQNISGCVAALEMLHQCVAERDAERFGTLHPDSMRACGVADVRKTYEDLIAQLKRFQKRLALDEQEIFVPANTQGSLPAHVKAIHAMPDSWLVMDNSEGGGIDARIKVESGRLVSALLCLSFSGALPTTWEEIVQHYPAASSIFGEYRQYIDESSWAYASRGSYTATIKNFPPPPKPTNSEA